ncbi:MAG: hypothetical protein SFW67_11230 [Myxococcaceae bacterium]|nr:hypothetical protein [Myxococcaceae bacterium]
MTRDQLEQLATLRIASPCPMRWSDLKGDHKTRYCGQCRLHVHKLSELRTDEALALVESSRQGRVCVQLFYRLDGTVMTKDCVSAWEVGVAEAVRRVGPAVNVASAAGVLLVLVVAAVLALATLFGDNVRALFGATAGALAGSSSVTRRPTALVHMPEAVVRPAAVERLPARAASAGVRVAPRAARPHSREP